jgi:hypothetical protein
MLSQWLYLGYIDHSNGRLYIFLLLYICPEPLRAKAHMGPRTQLVREEVHSAIPHGFRREGKNR